MRALRIGLAGLSIAGVTLLIALLLPKEEGRGNNPPVGTVLVQLGAHDSPADAHRVMADLRQRTGPLLAKLTDILVEVRTEDRVFWRLQAWPLLGLPEARRLCDKLIWEMQQPCVPVIQRD